MSNSQYLCIRSCTHPISVDGVNVRHKRFKEDGILVVPAGQYVPDHFRPTNKQAKIDRKAQIKADADKAVEGLKSAELSDAEKLAAVEAENKALRAKLDAGGNDEITDDADEMPSKDWSKARLLAYAEEELDMDIPDRTNKPEILTMIETELKDLEEDED